MQMITIDENRFPTYRMRPDFIQKYIFPGGMLPSPTAFRSHAAAAALMVSDEFTFGEVLCADAPGVAAALPARLGRHRRPRLRPALQADVGVLSGLLRGGFRAGSIDVGQFRLVKS